jgi:prophage DNA circulation protein
MSTVFEDLLTASFRGVTFPVNVERVQAGKKTITHEYPDSDRRFTEEQGKIPPKFSLEAWISDPDAISKRIRLENAFDQPGRGWLVHPIYGGIFVMATTRDGELRQTELGLFRLNLNFEVSEADITVTKAEPTSKYVAGIAVTKAMSDATDAFAAKYAATTGTADTLSAVTFSTVPGGAERQRLATAVTATFEAYKAAADETLDPDPDKLATFRNIINSNLAKVYTVVQKAEDMKQALVDTYTTLTNVVSAPARLIEVWRSLLTFSFATPENLTTVPEIRSTIHRSIQEQQTHIVALAGLTAALSDADYDTQTEVEAANAEFNNAFDQIVREGEAVPVPRELRASATPLVEDPAVLASLLELKSVFTAVMQLKEQQAWKIGTSPLRRTSFKLLTYQHYGALDNLDTIFELNAGTLNGANFDSGAQIIER